MQGKMVMNVPPILVGHGQGQIIAVQYLNLAHVETIRREGSRQWEEVDVGFPDERPGGDRCYQQDYGYLFSAFVKSYIHD